MAPAEAFSIFSLPHTVKLFLNDAHVCAYNTYKIAAMDEGIFAMPSTHNNSTHNFVFRQ